MNVRYLPDSRSVRKPDAPCSLGRLVAIAAGRPIYVTASPALRRPTLDEIVAHWGRRFPGATFQTAWGGLYRGFDDWACRWPRECEQYGALVVITFDGSVEAKFDKAYHDWRASQARIRKGARGTRQLKAWQRRRPRAENFFRGLGDRHVIGLAATQELVDFARLGRPAAWLATEGPFSLFAFLHARFAVQPLDFFKRSRFARLGPASDAEPFRPIIGDLPFRFFGNGQPWQPAG